MKRFAFVLTVTIAGYCTFAQVAQPLPFHKWQATLKIIDETWQPIAGANVQVSYMLPPPPVTPTWGHYGEYGDKIEGLTDTNGIFIASHEDQTPSLGITVEKVGYYKTLRGYEMGVPEHYTLEKWNPSLTVVLKKIGKPIAMYAKWINQNPPALDQPVGYDLMIGDWVSASHKGINTDIIFRKEAYRESGTDYEYKVKVTFPKSGDGIQIYTLPELEKGSVLRSPHEAPLNGYQPELNKERSAHPGQPTKNDDDPNRIYLFRVRTVIDDKGNVVSAHYGKIYGDFMTFTYYLNPTANDRNIEFDPKQNLIQIATGFRSIESPVTEP